MENTPFNEWTPCEVHGHSFVEGRCESCGEVSGETKTVTLTFEVPASLDTPSEVLTTMKEMLLDGLRYRAERLNYNPVRRRLMEALLTES
jgi:hypothetical protein